MRVLIIGVPQSTYLRTVRIVAEEMKIPYRLEPERPHGPAVGPVHPLGKVPAMRRGDFTLCDSRAIVAYFEGRFDRPKITPSDIPRAAKVEQWASMLTPGFI